MNRFAALFAALDGTTKTGAKTAALADYFRAAPDADKVWTVALLTGRRPKRAVNATELRLWAAEVAGIPDWLFEESYTVVGDLAETIALLLPPPGTLTDITLDQAIRSLIRLTGQPPETRKIAVLTAWGQLSATERFLYNKLLTGGFRMGVAQGLLTRALAQATGVEEAVLAHRLMGNWDPAHTSFANLIAGDTGGDARPYPFALASPLEDAPTSLGPREDWIAEWKWDGIRGQLIHRPGAFALWSRGGRAGHRPLPRVCPARRFPATRHGDRRRDSGLG
jgi:DNA ligase 1